MHKPGTISIEPGKRGFLAITRNPDPGRIGEFYAFDRIADLGSWLITQFPADPTAPNQGGIGQADPARYPEETDQRQGVTLIQHATLDVVEQRQAGEWKGYNPYTLARIAREHLTTALTCHNAPTRTRELVEAAAALIIAAAWQQDSIDQPEGAA